MEQLKPEWSHFVHRIRLYHPCIWRRNRP